MNALGEFLGEICKIVLPIPEKTYTGNPSSSIAICTLSNISLLNQLSKSRIMENVAIVGRLLSENKGINSMIKFVNLNPNIRTIILCGKDVIGHKPGHSLLELHKNGINSSGRIIDSHSPDPILTITKADVGKFQNQIKIINKIGTEELSEIQQLVESLKY